METFVCRLPARQGMLLPALHQAFSDPMGCQLSMSLHAPACGCSHWHTCAGPFADASMFTCAGLTEMLSVMLSGQTACRVLVQADLHWIWACELPCCMREHCAEVRVPPVRVVLPRGLDRLACRQLSASHECMRICRQRQCLLHANCATMLW